MQNRILLRYNGNMKYDTIIIGGGASGLMLAARMKVNKGLILEGSPRPGNKLLLTGGGRCNLTHAGSIKDFISCYGEAGKTFRKCLYRHSNVEMISWFESLGLKTMEQDERFYPASERAADVRIILVSTAENNGWKILTNSRVNSLKSEFFDESEVSADGSAEGSGFEGEKSGSVGRWTVGTVSGDSFTADNVVVATGGITYPETGSDGSMFDVLRQLDIEVTDLRPALSPIHVKDYPYAELAGVSIPDVTVTVFSSDVVNTCKGKAARETGDLLFTHTGFSGPAILRVSRFCEAGEAIRINYMRGISELPRRFRKILEDRARGESGDVRTNKLSALLEADTFVVESVDPRGIVTAGGIGLSQIDAGTLEFRTRPGLFAAGEALDADGTTGGYNLQLCYSTACAIADTITNKQ